MKTILVTGASKGIGKATAEKFLADGFKVYGTSRSGEIEISNPNFKAFALDLADEKSVDSFAEIAREENFELDILVNNAGVGFDFGQQIPDRKSFRKTMEVNMDGTMFLTENLLEFVKEAGKIAFISSRMGSIGDCKGKDSIAYRVSKAALNMYVKILSNKLEGKQKVTCIHPGWVQTEIASMNVNAPLVPKESAEKIHEFVVSNFKTGTFWNIVTQDFLEW
jgi:NAD(P)-dependent dehydrogenase (short-subunit alcohol dehydrogenase family)